MKTKTKSQIISAIQPLEILDSEIQLITKRASDANKRAALQRFLKKASEYVEDQRDVVLIAIKVK